MRPIIFRVDGVAFWKWNLAELPEEVAEQLEGFNQFTSEQDARKGLANAYRVAGVVQDRLANVAKGRISTEYDEDGNYIF